MTTATDQGLKRVVAMAAVAVIAAVGYYFWSEYSAYRARQDAELTTERARAELFEQAEAGPGDAASVRVWCKIVSDRLDTGGYSASGAEARRRLVSNCRALGYL